MHALALEMKAFFPLVGRFVFGYSVIIALRLKAKPLDRFLSDLYKFRRTTSITIASRTTGNLQLIFWR